MADVPAPMRGTGFKVPGLRKLLAARGFQKWAARNFLTRRIVRSEGEALFDLVAGFCHSQVLQALVSFDIPARLMDGPASAETLARQVAVPEDRMLVLLRAGAALGLLRQKRAGRFALSRRGAALVGVPGLQQMIRHHDVLYRDLADPVAFFRGETEPELAGFWPYVFGGDVDPQDAATYSDLMAQSQLLVADDTLDAISLRGVTRLMDVGGGSGAFLAQVGARYGDLQLTLFDLPTVAPQAQARFAAEGLSDRARISPGSFRTDNLPDGADAISLIRVLYDHTDATVTQLLKRCFAALPKGGRLIISEPMRGGAKPERAGDAYFALYTLAMGTGKARSAEEIADLCRIAGFEEIQKPAARRPFVTRCVTAVRKN
ncbi:methyltransferase [Sulfitobacter sp. JB4-11]|uniref:methyltransferase n=1 Tax=Sulfitobacter rhodophyticola TaxID=3238304 RepID=UPI0035170644